LPTTKPIELSEYCTVKNTTAKGECSSAAVAKQLASVLDRCMRNGDTKQLVLPSLTSIASFFNVYQMDAHEALQVLYKQGFDYAFDDSRSPILLWRK
jgi:hypothetical protein